METFIEVLVYVFIVGGYLYNLWLSLLNYSYKDKPIPPEVDDVYDQAEYKKWLQYNMTNFRFSMITSTIDIILFLILLISGAFLWFDKLATSLFSNGYLQMLLFIGLYFIVNFIVGIVTSYYDTFTIEERYGFNTSTKKTFVKDKIKSFLLTIILGGGLLYLIQVINAHTGNLFFVYTWVVIVTILVVVNLLYVSVFVPLFNKLTPLEDGELKEAINAFAKSVGYQVAQISVMDASRRSTRLNAYFTGFGKLKKIVLYDTLIEKMSTEEIVAVLAHEIGHNKHKHIFFNMIQMAITMLIYIGVFGFVLKNDVFSTAFGFNTAHFGFSFIVFFVLLGPLSIVIQLISSTTSRKAEYQADRYSAVHYDKKHIESALKVLARVNYANLTPHPLYVKLSYSHPPIADRIRAIRKVEKNES